MGILYWMLVGRGNNNNTKFGAAEMDWVEWANTHTHTWCACERMCVCESEWECVAKMNGSYKHNNHTHSHYAHTSSLHSYLGTNTHAYIHSVCQYSGTGTYIQACDTVFKHINTIKTKIKIYRFGRSAQCERRVPQLKRIRSDFV